MSTATITPMSPAKRLILAALDRTEDDLIEGAKGNCAECEEAAAGICLPHETDLAEARRMRELHDALQAETDPVKVAALPAGTERAA